MILFLYNSNKVILAFENLDRQVHFENSSEIPGELIYRRVNFAFKLLSTNQIALKNENLFSWIF